VKKEHHQGVTVRVKKEVSSGGKCAVSAPISRFQSITKILVPCAFSLVKGEKLFPGGFQATAPNISVKLPKQLKEQEILLFFRLHPDT
jgi:hypothetical protein